MDREHDTRQLGSTCCGELWQSLSGSSANAPAIVCWQPFYFAASSSLSSFSSIAFSLVSKSLNVG